MTKEHMDKSSAFKHVPFCLYFLIKKSNTISNEQVFKSLVFMDSSFLFESWLPYNTELISALQQSESVTSMYVCVYLHTYISLFFGLLSGPS